ncbi:Hypothetical_protein [Hexamita inflata]|uniref:Hypothetical_protein n=1 Tax=Hexamita inflata TaxID=28002 RepID=A0AA86PU49_9EUKA|nr:Hypothetical protein HINF_LOCUS34010 [Hexamita inflata]
MSCHMLQLSTFLSTQQLKFRKTSGKLEKLDILQNPVYYSVQRTCVSDLAGISMFGETQLFQKYKITRTALQKRRKKNLAGKRRSLKFGSNRSSCPLMSLARSYKLHCSSGF